MGDGRENLIPLTERTKEEQRAIATMGGKKSGETRRRKKQMKDIFSTFLAMQTKDGRAVDIDKCLAIGDVQGLPMTVEERICLKQVLAAADGNLQAACFVRDTIGEKPTEKMEVAANVAGVAEKVQKVLIEGNNERESDNDDKG